MKLTKRQQMAFQKKYAEAFEMGVRSRDSEVENWRLRFNKVQEYFDGKLFALKVENQRFRDIIVDRAVENDKSSNRYAYSRVQV